MSNTNKENLIKFLSSKRIQKGSDVPPTHSSWGFMFGSYSITTDDDLNIFLKLYDKAVSNDDNEITLIEFQSEYSPILVDIDIKVVDKKPQFNNRLYDDSLIINLVNIYIDVLKNIIANDEHKKILAWVLEKPNATKIDAGYKDGFHIMFPRICLSSKERHLIRDEIIKKCNDNNIFSLYTDEKIDIIIDKAVVSSNGWLMYKSKKPSGPLYKYTKLIDSTKTLKNLSSDMTLLQLIKMFSLRSKINKYSYNNRTKTSIQDITPFIDDSYIDSPDGDNDDTNIFNNNDKDIIKTNRNDNNISNDEGVIINIENIKNIVNMISVKRSENYSEWINVGLALHSISNELLEVWIDFSKKCPKLFKENVCIKYWTSFKNPTNGNKLTIKSLKFWAKIDNPEEYKKYSDASFEKEKNNSLLTTSNKSVTDLFYSRHENDFLLSDFSNNTWYVYKKYRWIITDSGHAIKLKLYESFHNFYTTLVKDIKNKIFSVDDPVQRLILEKQLSNAMNVEVKLGKNTFRNEILENLKLLYYDKDFEEKMDGNTNLLGFENGIYDLKSYSFRGGCIDDCLTLSTKNIYIPHDPNNETFKEIMVFFTQIIPNQDVRNYFIQVLSSCVCGDNREEKLYILTGSGSNGKSLLMDIMDKAFGEYYMSCPITMITRKRGTSNEASPEKVRMKGRRFGVFQETDDGEKMNIGIVKELTGGDKILVRDLYKGSKQMLEFKQQMKYFLTCNQLPMVPSNDDGIWRRIRVIDFKSKFTNNPQHPNEFQIDTSLKNKISKWGPVLMSYLIHIYVTTYSKLNYLVEPDEVNKSTKQYKSDNDSLQDFCNSQLSVTKKKKDVIEKEEMFIKFSSWYKSVYNNRSSLNKSEFLRQFDKIVSNDENNYINIKYKGDIIMDENVIFTDDVTLENTETNTTENNIIVTEN